MHFEVVRKLS